MKRRAKGNTFYLLQQQNSLSNGQRFMAMLRPETTYQEAMSTQMNVSFIHRGRYLGSEPVETSEGNARRERLAVLE